MFPMRHWIVGARGQRDAIGHDEVVRDAHIRRAIDPLDDVKAERQEDGQGREAAVPLGLLAFLTSDFADVTLELEGS